ncbi:MULTISPECIES: NrtA/SsuA/CpmA family ABC transporter substrate-binding protein [unclassified Bradyrhizobium]|uniref:NrtA/SsuA/CpmA family ABC transporter substrate-binding protein n=1 Tax=unclassified Bradyrhizobium TaxID=2631580 RepID=UPI001FF72417|nr:MULTISPECIES: NrtA/SsuA/CpmA family ABC transporter substrate-binding protein [unclassified Bradyrhizobium]MCK1710844.1 NrtA/SsuA/CpmA family ABC transporter substrate-binding protein [Bradyrhizobium sp. 143]MCK1728715.1 NrtA/SsuA/CpmA family ABC transporter substrate-binding protein [Bradyrhizobium sp. 142]
MHRKTTSRIAALASYVALSCLAAGPDRASAEELLKARLAQNLGPISGLAIVAKSKGIFEKHGLEITVSNFTSGKQCLDTVIGGGADIATTAEAPVTASAMANQPIAFVAGMEYSDLKTVVAAKAGIKTKADLRGKRIAFTAGTGSEVYTATLLKSAGLMAKDVTLVNLRPQEMLPALAAGSIDAFDTWEPHISNAKKALGEAAGELDTKGTYSETFNIVVMRAYLDANPALVEKFIGALIDAEIWTKAHPDEAIAVVADAAGMKRDELSAIWAEYIYRVRLDDRLIEILRTHAAWRLESGNHPPGATMPDFRNIIAAEPLKKLDPARVTLSWK